MRICGFNKRKMGQSSRKMVVHEVCPFVVRFRDAMNRFAPPHQIVSVVVPILATTAWRPRAQEQTASQVLVASSPRVLADEKGDLGDSGKVLASQSICICHRAQPLKSSQSAFWKVRVPDWSKPATWEMGLLSPQDWQAPWLNDGKTNPEKDADFHREDPAPLFRKEFMLPKKVAWARLYVSGLGYYEASLNGKRVRDQVLDPGWTSYSERALYSTYDVTSQVRRGTNCVGVMLGNGSYNPLPLRMWGNLNPRECLPVRRPRFIAQLEIEFADGTRDTVVSDSRWKVAEGPIRFNSIYLDEIDDARRETAGWDRPGLDGSRWGRPGMATESIGSLRARSKPPIRFTRTLKPARLTEPKPGVFVFNFGQNFAGWVNLRVSAGAGTKVVLRHVELLNPDGTLNLMTSVAGRIKGTYKTADGLNESVGGPGAPAVAWQSDTYLAKGKGIESYTPRFTFHSFRYVKMTGLPGKPTRDAITGLRLNADVERVGSISQTGRWPNGVSNWFGTVRLRNSATRFQGVQGQMIAASPAISLETYAD